ncbi:MAG: helix-turn-helix domain-containing protein [Woeseiaceae bacterium]
MKKSTRTGNAGTQSGKLNNTNLAAQRERLLSALLDAPVSTVQARHELNILAPAPRVYELRHDQGKNIVTNWIVSITPEGFKHRVAEYVLLSGKWEGNIHA